MSKSLNSNITKLITKYLSIREHSRLELVNKLSEKGYDTNDIHLALEEFSNRDIQSDDRFTEEFVRSRIKQGKWPRLILSELLSRGISEKLANEQISLINNSVWESTAKSALIKKLKSSYVSTDDYDKLYSFLNGRGFDHKMIKYVMNVTKNEC